MPAANSCDDAPSAQGSGNPVWVYQFESFDRLQRRFVKSERFALMGTIEAVKGIALKESKTLVDADCVDAAGYLI
jgi:hypothetical protein